MANQIISMNKLRKLLKLCIEGHSIRQISKLTGLSRNSIDKYKEMLNEHPLSFKELLKLSDKDLYSIVLPPAQDEKPTHQELYGMFPDIEKQLTRKGVTRLFLWEKYKLKHPSGVQYSQFCEHFGRYLKSKRVSYVFDHKAGDKLMVDYAGKKLHLTDADTGELIPVEFFVGILPCSSYTYCEASLSQQSPDFLGSLGRCLAYISGVPQAIVTDNLKPAVNKASKYDPEINQSLADFAEHYDTAILPTRARKPQDKALVESAVNILYTRVYAPLYDRVFHRVSDMNQAIWPLLDKHNGLLFQKRDYSRLQQFENVEKQTLKLLPVQLFEMRDYQIAKVHPNCHVFLSKDKHNYSVPYQYVGKHVSISYTSDTVEIYHNHARIATHERLKLAHKYTTNTSHLHPKHQYYSNWSNGFFIAQGINVGQNTGALIQQVLGQCKHPEQGYKGCRGILNLARKYGNERVENASKLCLMYDFVSFTKLEYILSKNLDKIDLKEQETPVTIKHDNVRGPSYYKQSKNKQS